MKILQLAKRFQKSPSSFTESEWIIYYIVRSQRIPHLFLFVYLLYPFLSFSSFFVVIDYRFFNLFYKDATLWNLNFFPSAYIIWYRQELTSKWTRKPRIEREWQSFSDLSLSRLCFPCLQSGSSVI